MDGGFDHIKYSGDKDKLLAWKEGKTGFPLIDASMRCVLVTGQVNFRLRGLLVSFLTHYLQCSWKEGARFLARKFIDYEPGIHFIQFQTQAGLALSEGIRIYDPVKQSKDKDPNGDFIKRWVPELVNLPKTFLHTPWKMSAEDQSRFRVILGEDYPFPVVPPEFPYELAQKLSKARSEGEKRIPKALKRRY
jgi:deoxyribodipyrimidine photo-lyase